MPKVIINEWCGEFPKGSALVSNPRVGVTLPIPFSCRAGTCGICAVEVLEGEESLGPKTPIEEATLKRAWPGKQCRLACQCRVEGDVTLDPLYNP